MRINSKCTVGGFPALLVRKLVRALTNRLYWDLETVESTRDRWQFGNRLDSLLYFDLLGPKACESPLL